MLQNRKRGWEYLSVNWQSGSSRDEKTQVLDRRKGGKEGGNKLERGINRTSYCSISPLREERRGYRDERVFGGGVVAIMKGGVNPSVIEKERGTKDKARNTETRRCQRDERRRGGGG